MIVISPLITDYPTTVHITYNYIPWGQLERRRVPGPFLSGCFPDNGEWLKPHNLHEQCQRCNGIWLRETATLTHLEVVKVRLGDLRVEKILVRREFGDDAVRNCVRRFFCHFCAYGCHGNVMWNGTGCFEYRSGNRMATCIKLSYTVYTHA